MADLTINEETMARAARLLDLFAQDANAKDEATLNACGDRGVAEAAERYEHWYRGAVAVLSAKLARAGLDMKGASAAFTAVDTNLSSGLRQ